MDDQELEDQLKSLDVPPPRSEQVEQSLELACQAFDDAQTPSTVSRRRRPIVAAWGVLGLAAGIALVVLLSRGDSRPGGFHGHEPYAGLFSAKDWRRIVEEVQGLFPERLQAVVASGGKLVHLAKSFDTP